MTVGDLREYMAGLRDDVIVEVPVSVYTRIYPVAYVKPEITKVVPSREEGKPGVFRISISLPEGMSIVQRKAHS